MTILKLAYLRQDNILHLTQTTGNNKPRKAFEDSTLISSIINSDRQNNRGRYNRGTSISRGSFRGNITNNFDRGINYNKGRGFDNTRGRGINDRSRAFISRGRGNFRGGYQNQNKCYICREFGHTAVHCPAVRETIEKKQRERLQIKDHAESSTSHMAFTFYTIADNEPERLRFILDSGTTQHMTPHKELLQEIRPSTRRIRAAGNSIIDVKGEGNILAQVGNMNSSISATIKDVLYSSKLRESLISIVVINNNRYDVLFKSNGLV